MSEKHNNQNFISNEMIENIKNYADEIVTIEDFVAVVRQNPGYHLGAKGNKGYKNMVRETTQNGFDEVDKQSSPATEIWVEFNEITKSYQVIDNGRGLPFNNIIRIITNPNTSSNYQKKKGEYSSGLHGVGAKVTNAMSKIFIAESYILGEARRVEFIEGIPWGGDNTKGEDIIPNYDNFQGTKIYFEPSDVLGEVTVSWEEVYHWLADWVLLSKIGTKVHFTAIKKDGTKVSEEIINQDGIMTYIIRETESPLIAPIYMYKDTGELKMEVVVTWDISEMATNHIIAFSNKCPTIFGTHIDGFEEGISKYFTNYMNKIYLASTTDNKKKKKALTIIPSDIKSGIKAVIAAACLIPIFDGQSKEKLVNDEMLPFMRDSIIELLDEWSKSNPKDLSKLCKYFKDIAELRVSVDDKRVKLTNKYDKSKLTGLPTKFVAPTGNKGLELFITEGDSAAGLIKNNRINAMQGYFPIRGKLPNAFNTSKVKFLSNAEVAGIITIIGGGYGKEFDINKVKWDKIIFCTDADPDGNHICALLLRFFILYMPQLIEAGKVYKALPPLYGIKLGKDRYVYLKDRLQYVQYIQKEFSRNYSVTKLDDQSLSYKQLSKILYNNIDYKYELDKVANRYAIDPILLESIIILKYNNCTENTISKNIKKQFKFIDNIRSDGDTLIIEGLVNSRYQTVFVNESLINDCNVVIDIIRSNEDLAYKVNGKVMSIYEILSLFDKSAPSSIQRYKGLGEMDGKRLFNSTLDPSNRTLIQYTIDNIKEDLESIKYYESNTIELLKDVKVSRFDVME